MNRGESTCGWPPTATVRGINFIVKDLDLPRSASPAWRPLLARTLPFIGEGSDALQRDQGRRDVQTAGPGVRPGHRRGGAGRRSCRRTRPRHPDHLRAPGQAVHRRSRCSPAAARVRGLSRCRGHRRARPAHVDPMYISTTSTGRLTTEFTYDFSTTRAHAHRFFRWCASESSPAHAQTSTGGPRGFVRDGTGGVLAGVTVEASSPARIGAPAVTVTDAQGLYSFTNLPVGEYRSLRDLPASPPCSASACAWRSAASSRWISAWRSGADRR